MRDLAHTASNGCHHTTEPPTRPVRPATCTTCRRTGVALTPVGSLTHQALLRRRSVCMYVRSEVIGSLLVHLCWCHARRAAVVARGGGLWRCPRVLRLQRSPPVAHNVPPEATPRKGSRNAHVANQRGGDMLIEVCARVGCAALPLYVPSPYAATAVAPLSVAVRPDENAARCHNATGGARWAAKIRPDLRTRARNAHVLSVRPAGENSAAPSRPNGRPSTVPTWGVR